MLFDDEELDGDLAEVMSDLGQVADFRLANGTVARGVPIAIGDVTIDGSTDRAAYRGESAAIVTVSKSLLPIAPAPGTQLLLPDGRRFRVTQTTHTPGDVAYTLAVENRSKQQ